MKNIAELGNYPSEKVVGVEYTREFSLSDIREGIICERAELGRLRAIISEMLIERDESIRQRRQILQARRLSFLISCKQSRERQSALA